MSKTAILFPITAKRTVVLTCCAVWLFCSFIAQAFTLVIDPGHGGKDFGATGRITNEKSINLKVSKKLGDLIAKNMPEVKTVFTRSTDKFISLQERAKIANRENGDLFISIHVNSVAKRNRNRSTINGASVYTLGLHKSADNLEVAKRENSVMVLEDDYHERYEGFNPESAESYIIFELSQNKHFEQSLKLADEIQTELTETAGRGDRGVRQAGFWVLWSTSMPSVLIELDFICNPTQEKFMASEQGQNKMAQAIYNAISRYICTNGSLPAKIKNSNSVPIHDVDKTYKGKYTVIFLTTSAALGTDSPSLKNMSDVYHIQMGTLHRYCTSPVGSLAEAEKVLSSVKDNFPAAFIQKIE